MCTHKIGITEEHFAVGGFPNQMFSESRLLSFETGTRTRWDISRCLPDGLLLARGIVVKLIPGNLRDDDVADVIC